MSAFMVGRDHIRFLVSAAERFQFIQGIGKEKFSWYWSGARHYVEDRDDFSRIGQVLWGENLESIHARYPDTIKRPDRTPGPIGETYIYTHSRPWKGQINPIAVLKAIACLRYQSCEHDGWGKSEAYAILQALENDAIRSLPGYNDAEWEVEEKKEVR